MFPCPLFLFDRKIHFLSNKKTRLCELARGEIIADATALGAGVRQGAHFFNKKLKGGRIWKNIRSSTIT